jgi:phospholipid-binding lipoprotein MlaA
MNKSLTLRARRFMSGCLLLGAALLGGCAVSPSALPHDPWEPFNREVTDFNENLDKAVLKPVATVYKGLTPPLVRQGVGNFFNNLSDVWSLVNNVLQLKPKESIETFFRVGVNTTMGLGGLIDVATELRLERHREDFGQTLGYWGVPTGPYVVLPLFGPSTLRDSLAMPVDWQIDPVGHVNQTAVRNSLTVLRVVGTRAEFLQVGNLLDDAALDKYSFTRDAFLQRRRGLAVEGKAQTPEPEERYDLPEAPATPASDLTPSGSGSSPARQN